MMPSQLPQPLCLAIATPFKHLKVHEGLLPARLVFDVKALNNHVGVTLKELRDDTLNLGALRGQRGTAESWRRDRGAGEGRQSESQVLPQSRHGNFRPTLQLPAPRVQPSWFPLLQRTLHCPLLRTFIFSSSFSHSTLLSSCTSCCMNWSPEPHPKEAVRSLVDAGVLLYWSCGGEEEVGEVMSLKRGMIRVIRVISAESQGHACSIENSPLMLGVSWGCGNSEDGYGQVTPPAGHWSPGLLSGPTLKNRPWRARGRLLDASSFSLVGMWYTACSGE